MMTELEAEKNVNTILIDEPLTAQDLRARLDDAEKGVLTYFWTPLELELIREYAPTTYYRIAEEKDIDAATTSVPELYAKLVMQAQSELINNISTLDAGIIHEWEGRGTVESKAHNYNRLGQLFAILGVRIPLWGLLPNPKNTLSRPGCDLRDVLIETKELYAKILKHMPQWRNPVEIIHREADEQLASDPRFGYVSDVLDLVGDSVIGVVLYGSAARELDPDSSNDYDNYLVVRNGLITSVLRRLKAQKFKNPYDGKHVGYNVVEEGSFARFLRLDHDPQESLERCVVLHGEADFPIVSPEEGVENGVSFALLRLKSLKSAAGWCINRPRFLQGKEALYAYFQKTPMFIAQAGLNYRDGVSVRSKEEFLAEVRAVGGDILPFRENDEYIIDATCQAAVSSTQLLEKYFKGKKFENIFINVDAAPLALDATAEQIADCDCLSELYFSASC